MILKFHKIQNSVASGGLPPPLDILLNLGPSLRKFEICPIYN